MNSQRDWSTKTRRMKIRIKGNSIRYRMTKSEVKAFCDTGYFEKKTQFPNAIFTYALQREDTHENIEAHFNKNRILLTISKNLVHEWATNNKVGFQYNLPLETGKSLSLLIEKDFVCMDETVEDQSDNYPNPLAGEL